MSNLLDYGDSCFMCQIKRRYDCNLVRPACQNCQADQRTCHWDGSLANIAAAWPEFPRFNLSGMLIPSDPWNQEQDAWLGAGSFGDVFRAQLADQPRFVAVKVPRRKNVPPVRELALCLREAKTWSTLTHPNIVPLIGVSYTVRDMLCFVSEEMHHGDILAFLREYPSQRRIPLLRDIARGVEYLHEEVGVVHGDLKAMNVLVSAERRARLTDFGLSCIVEELAVIPGNDTSSAMATNSRWAAPERLRPDYYGISFQDSRTRQSDIFSMFRTFLEVLTNSRPFHPMTDAAVVNIVSERQSYQHPIAVAQQHGLTEGLWKLMERGWQWQPAMRPSAEEVIEYMEDM